MIYKRKSKLKPLLLAITILCLLGLAGFLAKDKLSHEIKDVADTTSPSKTLESTTKVGPKMTRLIAASDFIGHDALINAAKSSDGTYSFAPFMDQMKPILNTADIRFCNQATLVGGEKFGVSGYPAFNAPEAFAKDMAGVGCNVINTASNHSSDKNQAVIDANVALWQKIQGTLTIAGQNSSQDGQNKVHYFEVDGLKYAFLAYTTYSNIPPPYPYSVNMYSRQFAATQIAAAKAAGAKFIIASMRWGTEYSQDINSYQQAESQYLADQGVSLILGHGPHVLEPVKTIKGASGNETLVWYSLGNFLHAQLEPETIFNGVAVIEIDPKSATISSKGFLPIYMHYDWTAEQAARQDLLARKNFELVPLESAKDLFAKSQLKTTIDAQKQRLTTTLNKFEEVKMLSTSDL